MAATYLINDVRFPGVDALRASYTVSHGITPGRISLSVAPTGLDRIAEVGDLVFSDGSRSLPVKDCKVVRPSFDATAGGQIETLLLEDRRWRWALCDGIGGRYNIPDETFRPTPPVDVFLNPQGNAPLPPPPIPPGEEAIRAETRKTATELAVLCLRALGETGYDVSALDPTATPAVSWDATPPAQALQQLVEALGCRVVFRPLTNTVLIAKVGEGAELPDGNITPGDMLTDAPGFDVKARPAKLVCYGAVARFQQRFALKAVGIDFDGTYQPIDDLSYKPENGWTLCPPPSFPGLPYGTDELPGIEGTLPGGRRSEDARALAARSVYRCYRITTTGARGFGDLLIPPNDDFGIGPITDIRLVRLLPLKNLSGKDDVGRSYQAPAQCYGKHFPPHAVRIGKDIVSVSGQTTLNTEVRVPFSIDQEHGVVTFSSHLFLLDATDHLRYPADIVIECACEVADPRTFQWLRYRRELPMPGGLEDRVAAVIREDVRYEVVAEYGQNNTYVRVSDNRDQIRPRVDYYLLGESLKYQLSATGQRSYPGIMKIDPDGAISQITWECSPGGPTTTVSRNSEHADYRPNFRQRRAREESDLAEFKRSLAETPKPFIGPLADPASVRA